MFACSLFLSSQEHFEGSSTQHYFHFVPHYNTVLLLCYICLTYMIQITLEIKILRNKMNSQKTMHCSKFHSLTHSFCFISFSGVTQMWLHFHDASFNSHNPEQKGNRKKKMLYPCPLSQPWITQIFYLIYHNYNYVQKLNLKRRKTGVEQWTCWS